MFNGNIELSVKKDKFFQSTHWNDPNVLAHVRFNERVIDGQPVLFIEEIQSDWAQKGKKEGFGGETERVKAIRQSLNESQEFLSMTKKELAEVIEKMHQAGLPNNASSTEVNSFGSYSWLEAYHDEYNGLERALKKVRNNRDYDAIQDRQNEIYKEFNQLAWRRTELIKRRSEIEKDIERHESELEIAKARGSNVPDMPFKTTDQWAGLSIDRKSVV